MLYSSKKNSHFAYPTFFCIVCSWDMRGCCCRWWSLSMMIAKWEIAKNNHLLTQCTVNIWNYPANNNHNVQLRVAKEFWVAKLVLWNENFSQNCTTSIEFCLKCVWIVLRCWQGHKVRRDNLKLITLIYGSTYPNIEVRGLLFQTKINSTTNF